jgi:hypothetical protein
MVKTAGMALLIEVESCKTIIVYMMKYILEKLKMIFEKNHEHTMRHWGPLRAKSMKRCQKGKKIPRRDF